MDLGDVYDLARLDIDWYHGNTGAQGYYQYRVEVSDDDKTYTTVLDKIGNTTVGDNADDITARGRYVRIFITKIVLPTNPSLAPWSSIWECRVYRDMNKLENI